MGNLQCQHEFLSLLNTSTQYVSNFLSNPVLIRSLKPGTEKEKFACTVAQRALVTANSVSTTTVLPPSSKADWTAQTIVVTLGICHFVASDPETLGGCSKCT